MALFGFAPDSNRPVVVEFDVDDIGATADWAIFDVILTLAPGWIDGNDDFFTAGITDVGGFVTHSVIIDSATTGGHSGRRQRPWTTGWREGESD